MDMSTSPVPAGQVCDRCRLKKIKCDGAVPLCGNCSASSACCTTSAKLRRRTKIRGFKNDSDAIIHRLQAENAALAEKLKREVERSATLQRQIEDRPPAPNSRHSGRETALLHYESQSLTIPTDLDAKDRAGSALVIKHMGRLVADAEDESRFAGSTTGVHFILCVQQVLLDRGVVSDRFPENCFRLHLLQHSQAQQFDPLRIPSRMEPECFRATLKDTLRQPLGFYRNQIAIFQDKWSRMCPVIASTDLNRSIAALLSALQENTPLNDLDAVTPGFHVAMILLVNDMTSSSCFMNIDDRRRHLGMADMLLPLLVARADACSIQGMILLSLYIQISGQVLFMPQVNGLLARAAQTAGLHRHCRRFKFNAGQIELRKRLWWWIYIFDKITSFTHGLPQIIQDSDVDVDFPADCELTTIETDQLDFPLPGETTPASDFISLAHLGRILASTLEQLYTTTKRRHGAEKIRRLHESLQAWKERFNGSMRSESQTRSFATTRIWLDFMYQFAQLMIHRPGLTFDDKTPDFQQSLENCRAASVEIVRHASSPAGRAGLLGVAPLNAGLLFQSGLMQIYHQCYIETGLPLHSPQDSVFDVLEVVQELLANYQPAYQMQAGDEVDSWRPKWTRAMSEACQLLRSLQQETSLSINYYPRLMYAPACSGDTIGSRNPAQAMSQSREDGHSPPSVFFGVGSVDSLNNLESLDWILDEQFGTMSGIDPSPEFWGA